MAIKYILKCDKCPGEYKGTAPSLEDVKDIKKPHVGCGGTFTLSHSEEFIKNESVIKPKDNKTKSTTKEDIKKDKEPNADLEIENEPNVEESVFDENETEDESNENIEYICKFCDKNPHSKWTKESKNKKEKIGHNIGKYRGHDKCTKSKENVTLCYSRDTHLRSNSKNKLPTDMNVSDDVAGIVVDKQLIKINEIRRLFVSNPNNFSLYDNKDRGKPRAEVWDQYQELTDGIIGLHLLGAITIGVRPFNPKDFTGLWIGYDIDKTDKDGNVKVKNPEETVDAIIDLLKEWYGLNAHAQLSGSEGSYHIWIFLKPTNYQKIMDFDQSFKERCEKECPEINKYIDKRVEKPDGRMIALPFGINIKNGVRSSFVFEKGVDFSKIEQQELPQPWGNRTTEVDKVEGTPELLKPESKEEKEYRVNRLLNDLFKPDNEGKITVTLKCDNPECNKIDDKYYTIDVTKERLLNPHKCGGNIKIKIYQARLEILNYQHEEVGMFMENRYNNPDKKNQFAYEIEGDELILKLATYNAANSEASWLNGSKILKGRVRYTGKVEEIFV